MPKSHLLRSIQRGCTLVTMNAVRESKIPFVILLPFLGVVFVLSLKSGAPTEPSMPGVVRPEAPKVEVKAIQTEATLPKPETNADAQATDQVADPAASPEAAEAPAESWE